jgi:hypothetical protein
VKDLITFTMRERGVVRGWTLMGEIQINKMMSVILKGGCLGEEKKGENERVQRRKSVQQVHPEKIVV